MVAKGGKPVSFDSVVLEDIEEKTLREMKDGKPRAYTEEFVHLISYELVRVVPYGPEGFPVGVVLTPTGTEYIRYLDQKREFGKQYNQSEKEQLTLTKRTFYASIASVALGIISIAVTIALALLFHK